jgi:hypothetical protein
MDELTSSYADANPGISEKFRREVSLSEVTAGHARRCLWEEGLGKTAASHDPFGIVTPNGVDRVWTSLSVGQVSATLDLVVVAG